MNLQIRKCESADYPAVASLVRKELGYAALDEGRFLARMERMEASPFHATLVAQWGAETAGFIGLHREISYEIEGEYLRILALAVSQERQQRGIGSALLAFARDYARPLGIARFVLTSGLPRTAAHAFYEKNGFIKKSFGFTQVF